jgi:hypothetical protein
MPDVDEAPLADDEFKRIHRTLQELALAAYPNPERRGCPGTEVLREIANTSWPADHPGYDHVRHCSPCLREMLDLQEEIFLAETRRGYRTYRIAIAAMLVVAAGIGFAAWRRSQSPNSSHASTNNSSIMQLQRTADLFDAPDVLRGAEPQNSFKTIYLPPAPLQLKVILPRFSDPGVYQIAICQDRSEDSTLVKAVGRAVADGPREIVTVMLDLSIVNKGSYWLSAKGEDEAGTYYFPTKVFPGA